MLGNLVKEQCSVFVLSRAPSEEMLSVFNTNTTAQWRVRYVFFSNMSFFNELQLVRNRVCKICDFQLPVR